ncbi:MAG: 1,4-beta-xylanase, partial [Proteiniphilum sp.]
MKKELNILIILILCLTVAIFCKSYPSSKVNSKVNITGKRVPLADPFILLYNDTYYLYGTGAGNGIEVMT